MFYIFTMKKFALFFLITSLATISKANIKDFFIKYDIPQSGKKVITAINGFDCINCYKGLSIFLETLKNKEYENNYAVVSGLTEREVAHFFKKTLVTDYSFKKVIISNDFFNELNKSGTSKVIVFDNVKKIYEATSKELLYFNYELLQNDNKNIEIGNLIDSLDITSLLTTSAVDLNWLGENKILLSDKREGTLVTYDLQSKKVIDSINLNNFYNSQVKEKLYIILKDSAAVKFNIQALSNPKLDIDKNIINIVSIETVKNKIYVGVRFLIREMYKDKAIMMKYKLLITEFTDKLEFVCDYLLPVNISTDKESYIDVLFMRPFENSKNFIHITSGIRDKDTLLSRFTLKPNEMAVLDKVYGCTFPKYMPKLGKNGLPMFYQVNLLINGKDTLYFYNRDYVLYNLNNSSKIVLPEIDKLIKKNDNFYLQKIFNYKKNNIVITSQGSKKTTAYIFSLDFKKMLSKKDIFAGYFEQIIIQNHKIICLKVKSDKTMLYMYQINTAL